MKTIAALAVMLSLLLAPTADAQSTNAGPPSTTLPRVFIEDQLEAPASARVADALPPGFAVALGARLESALSPDDRARFDRYFALLAARKLRAWLAVPAPASVDAMATWQAVLREVLDAHAAGMALLEVRFAAQPNALRRFALQVASTEARARGVALAVSGVDDASTATMMAAIDEEAAPYIDALALSMSFADAAKVDAFAVVVPGAPIVRHSADVGGDVDARARVVREVLATIGSTTAATAWRGQPEVLATAVGALAPLTDLVAHPLETIDTAAADLTLVSNDRDVTRELPHRLLLDRETFATYFIYDATAFAVDVGGFVPPGTNRDGVSFSPAKSGDALRVSLRLAPADAPTVLDVVSGKRSAVINFSRDESTTQSRLELPATSGPTLVTFGDAATSVFTDRTAVSAERRLSVGEIIARHRQYQARLDAAVSNYRAAVTMAQHFRPTLTDPGYDVVTENEYFVERGAVEWQELSFSVNGSKWDADRPSFPLLQAEKVLSLPLELRLDQSYRYELAGSERVDDTECYRVRFAPLRDDQALYRGTVWIDRRTFARIRVQAVQTRTSAPIVSNEEIHNYTAVAERAGLPIVLLSRLTARQTVLIAGRNILLEKAADFRSFVVNDAAFATTREAARQSNRVMFRETERGLRYLVKDGETRVVSERATTHAKAMAMGVLLDPSFAYPLPIFGINYLDFEFAGRSDTQLAVLFAGVLAAGNLQRPRIGGSPFDVSVDFFAIAPPANERLYSGGGEQSSERLLTWPLSTGLNLGYQYSAFEKVQLQYQFRFDGFVRDRTTAESYVVPASTVTHGVGGAWEYKRGGYNVALNGTWFGRGAWRPWGRADAIEDSPRTYIKYAAHLSRDWFFNVFQKIHLNASYFGGERLDRFSRYQFGLFDDTRIHGVPASGVRFDRVGMLRGSYSLNIFEQYRVDLFAEQAWGLDRTVDTSWRPLTGLGVALNLKAPWNTILRADVGKSLLPEPYRAVGSTVVQIMILKPLR